MKSVVRKDKPEIQIPEHDQIINICLLDKFTGYVNRICLSVHKHVCLYTNCENLL